MPDELQSIVQRMIDAGESEENIGTVIQHFKQAPKGVNPELARLQGASAPNELGRITPDPNNFIQRNPATVGAMVGGVVAAPLTGGASLLPAMAATGLGAAGGAGLGMLTSAALDPNSPAPNTSQGVLRTMAKEGAIAAGSEGGTRLVGMGLKALAPKVMDTGLWRTGAQRMEFPNTPQRLVDEGLLPTSQRVQTALTGAEQGIQAKATAFDAAHPISPVDPDTLAAEAHATAMKTGRVADLGNVPGPDAASVDAAKAQYLRENTATRSLSDTIAQKRAFQQRASYNPRPLADNPTGGQLNFDTGMAAANRNAAIKLDPSLEADFSRQQDLLGAKNALGFTEARGTPLTVGGIARHTLMLPVPLGGAAIGMDRIGQVLRNPALLRAAMLSALLGQTQGGGVDGNR
jgi:hypothetical protein